MRLRHAHADESDVVDSDFDESSEEEKSDEDVEAEQALAREERRERKAAARPRAVPLHALRGQRRERRIHLLVRLERGGEAHDAHARRRQVDAHHGVHRVVAELDARNLASAALCERLDMRHEATHRQDLFSKGEWTDTLVYAMLASDRGVRGHL